MLSAPITPAFVNELLARCDIVQLIDARVPLQKKGRNYLACCPFHTEKTPSFTVTPEKQFYYCFGCSSGGNALSFLMNYDRLSFPEAVAQLAEQYGLSLPQAERHDQGTVKQLTGLYSLMNKVSEFYKRQLHTTPAAVEYVSQRGLSSSIIEEFGLGYAAPDWNRLRKTFRDSEALLSAGLLVKQSAGRDAYDRFRDRLIFPIHDQRGRVIGFGGRVLGTGEPKYLNSPETALFHKSKVLYGLYEVSQTYRQLSHVLVVEGYMDALALFQAGIPSVATLGTATSADQIARLLSMTQEIIFCFDGDEAGQRAAWRVLETSLEHLQDGHFLRFLTLPTGEDPDSFIRKNGREAFLKYVQGARSLNDFLFDHLLSSIDASHAAGKARLAKLAVPLIEKIPVGILQHKLFEQLAFLVNLDIPTLKQLTRAASSPSRKTTSAQSKRSIRRSPTQPSPMRLAIALLVQHPSLGKTLSQEQSESLSQLDLPGSALLIQLLALLRQFPDLNSGMLLEYWRGDEHSYRILTQLLQRPIAIPESGLHAEFHDLLNHLKKSAMRRDIARLLQRARGASLAEEERKHLYQLILETRSERRP